MSHRFDGIPLHARREDRTFKSVSTSFDHPWYGREIRLQDGKVWLMDAPEGPREITEDWHAFTDTLPVQRTVTFTWTEPPNDSLETPVEMTFGM